MPQLQSPFALSYALYLIKYCGVPPRSFIIGLHLVLNQNMRLSLHSKTSYPLGNLWKPPAIYSTMSCAFLHSEFGFRRVTSLATTLCCQSLLYLQRMNFHPSNLGNHTATLHSLLAAGRPSGSTATNALGGRPVQGVGWECVEDEVPRHIIKECIVASTSTDWNRSLPWKFFRSPEQHSLAILVNDSIFFQILLEKIAVKYKKTTLL